jgi:hypothetical protein
MKWKRAKSRAHDDANRFRKGAAFEFRLGGFANTLGKLPKGHHRAGIKESRRRGSNPQPTVYKTVALPLSYIGGQRTAVHFFGHCPDGLEESPQGFDRSFEPSGRKPLDCGLKFTKTPIFEPTCKGVAGLHPIKYPLPLYEVAR